MTPSTKSPPLLRVILLTAIGLGVMVSVSASQEAALAMSVESLTPREFSLGPLKGLLTITQAQEAALRAQERATLSAIEAMATPRAIVLGLLAVSALLVFVTALQIRWSIDAPPAALARRLGIAALASAVLRTLDGAQQLVIARRAAEANGRALLGAGAPDSETVIAVTRTLVSAVSVGWTLLIVAFFVALGTYIRSPKVLTIFVEAPEE
jgi:hypothetical protein